ncbi:MAG: heme peroxidase [Acaryochloridaceae cyanobacterium RL_2_7]|nr:heme peroxidase [Acaryochloridaceae cyanobacterium RL_2_7]
MKRGRRDRSRDGFRNRLEVFFFSNFRGFWWLIQRNQWLKLKANEILINIVVNKLPNRPHALSTLSPYTSWSSLTDQRWTGRHLPPAPDFNHSDRLPSLEALQVLFQKRDGKTIYSDKSTLLFPYWVQWFTDGFLRVDPNNRQQNTSNHQIDLSPVYGLTPKATDVLRSKIGGKLKSQMINGEEYPEYLYADPQNNIFKEEFEGLYEPLNRVNQLPAELKAKFFAMGVERSNVQIGYVMLNVLCLREHNRLCNLLSAHHPDWDDERLFQTARNILIVIILKIVVEEYVNHITPYHFNVVADPQPFWKAQWNRPNWMTVEFSLVYRWHSALPDRIQYNGQDYPVVETMWNNDLITRRGLGILFDEASSQPATQIGLFNTSELLQEVELATVQWGRETQMASYNDYREMSQYPRVTDFDQITGDPETQALLKDLYGHVDNVEFYVGLNAEDPRPDSAIPLLIERLIASDAFSAVLTNPLFSEHVFKPETFSKEGWQEILKTRSLAQIVQRNIPDAHQNYRVSFYQDG